MSNIQLTDKWKRRLTFWIIIIIGGLISRFWIGDSWQYLFGIFIGMASGAFVEYWNLVEWQKKMNGEMDDLLKRMSEAKDNYDNERKKLRAELEDMKNELRTKYKMQF